MKNLSFNLFIAILVMIITLTSCDKDPDDIIDEQTTVSEDKTNIRNSLDNVLNGIEAMKNGDAITAIDDFLNIQDGEVLNEDWIEELFEELDEHIDIDYVEETNKFNFSSHTGTYTWQSSSESWTKSNNPSDKIVFEFPAKRGSSSNNAIASFNSYQDKNITFDGEQFWLPTSLSFNLKIDNNEIILLNLNKVIYEESDFSIPIEIDVDMKVKPYNFSFKANRETSKKFHFEIKYDNNGSDKFSMITDISLAHSDYENIDLEDDIKYASGEISYDELSIPFDCDIETLIALDDPTENQINSLINVDVFFNGQKIGDLEYKDLGSEEVYIVYKDGSSENTSLYYDDFIDNLELIMLEFTGEWKKKKKHDKISDYISYISNKLDFNN